MKSVSVEDDLLEKGKIINVPQGRSGRLMKATLAYGVSGLYTFGFTTCNIIAMVGKEKLALIHADLQVDPEYIDEEAKWFNGDLLTVIVIYRDQYKHALTVQMLPALRKMFPEILIEKVMDNQHDGVLLTFDQHSDNELHQNIVKFPISEHPKKLIYHPDEQRLVAVQKIEQVIGLHAKYITKKAVRKYLNIFDGRCWEHMMKHELEIHTAHEVTKKELKIFSQTDDYVTICGKLMGVVDAMSDKIPVQENLKDLVMPIAVELEGYLNNFDPQKIFLRNFKALLSKSNRNNIFQIEKPSSSHDNAVVKNLGQAFVDQNPVDRVIEVMGAYTRDASQTGFKKQLVDEFNTFYKHYNQRMKYKLHSDRSKELMTKSEKLLRESVSLSKEKKYEAARNLSIEALTFLSWSVVKSNPSLASAYWNIGRCTQRLGDFGDAMFFIKSAITLRKNHLELSDDHKDIVLLKKALEECQFELQKQNCQETLEK